MKYLLFFLTLAACQVDESDNYYKTSRAPTGEAPFFSELQGYWIAGPDHVQIDGSNFCCHFGEYSQVTITAWEQKYIQIEAPMCGFGHVIPFMLRPPYDSLSLLRDGSWITLWKRSYSSADSCTP